MTLPTRAEFVKTRSLAIQFVDTVGFMGRGRPRDEDAQQRILEAAFRLVGEEGPAQVRIDAIAEAAGVGKQTIYRWWPTKTAVVMDALVKQTMAETPFPDTGDARADLRAHMRSVVRLFRSPTGCVIREMVAEAQGDPSVAEEFRVRFWQPRRDLSTACLRAGIARGQVRDDVPLEIALDAIYGVLWVRLLIGHRKLNGRVIDQILDLAWGGLAHHQSLAGV
jgi:AcrR family transcriptional regulator